MPEHVHVFVRAEPTISPNRIIAALKGYTSRVLRQEFVELRSKLLTLWSRSYSSQIMEEPLDSEQAAYSI